MYCWEKFNIYVYSFHPTGNAIYMSDIGDFAHTIRDSNLR